MIPKNINIIRCSLDFKEKKSLLGIKNDFVLFFLF